MRSLIPEIILSSTLLVSVVGHAARQNANPPQTPANHRIVLDVVVTDKSGKSIAGLQEQDFTILDDKTPAKITSFQASESTGRTSDLPVEAIILVDAVNGSSQNVIYEAQQLERFFRRGQLSLPTALVIFTFTDTSTQIQPQPTR